VAESRSLLAAALRVRRRRREVTQVRLAALLGSSQSRVAKMEAADSTVSLELLVRGLVALGATRREVGRIVAEGRRVAAGGGRGGSHDGKGR
jgi:transcriptional regulator with XRE-family HTH domain